MASIEHYYAVLGLPPSAAAREIKQAHRDLVRLWHPDKFAAEPNLQAKATERLKNINEAYEELRKSLRRPEHLSTGQQSNRHPRRPPRAPVEHTETTRSNRTRARAPRPNRQTGPWNHPLIFLAVGFAIIAIGGGFKLALHRRAAQVGPAVTITSGIVQRTGAEPGSLYITNASRLDAVVTISHKSTLARAGDRRAIFVRAGDSANVESIPWGSYVVSVAQGRHWLDTEMRFTTDMRYFRLSRECYFTQDETGMRYYTIVLEPGDPITQDATNSIGRYETTEIIEPGDFPLNGVAVEGARP